MGPGRKHADEAPFRLAQVYHKLCLKCTQCGKRLDPGSLVQHDELVCEMQMVKKESRRVQLKCCQPYCSRCHTQLFGTRGELRHGSHLCRIRRRLVASSRICTYRHLSDLRHANVLPSSSPIRTPTRPTPSQPATPLSPPSARRPPPATEFYTPPSVPSLNAVPGPTPASPADPSTPITRPNFRDARPISVPFAGGAAALDERGLLRRGESPRTKVGERVVGDEMCNGCGKRVYAAEQVFAIGQKWHKACLRCSSCKSTLDPSKVSDKDGQVFCKNCYAKHHGPGGILGKR
ncbi:hypothetical protein JCM24511_06724 [Saitozyma sp. JCM 24511]|nr:hypothetical protein JCM24511_06724 [Saitozyma sp. JCM 24511]